MLAAFGGVWRCLAVFGGGGGAVVTAECSYLPALPVCHHEESHSAGKPSLLGPEKLPPCLPSNVVTSTAMCILSQWSLRYWLPASPHPQITSRGLPECWSSFPTSTTHWASSL